MSVRVISGANSENLNVAGQSVGAIRSRFGTALTIAPGAQASINGGVVTDDASVTDGDTLQFTKETAEKG